MNKYRFFNQNLTVYTSKLTFLFNSSGTVRLPDYQPIFYPRSRFRVMTVISGQAPSRKGNEPPNPAET